MTPERSGSALVKPILIATFNNRHRLVRPRPIAPRRLRLSARHRPQHHPGHPLRHLEQFHRPPARRLRRRRMRGEARGGDAAEGGPAGARGAKPVAEDVRLLPAGAGRRSTWSSGRRTVTRRRPSGATIPKFPKTELFRLGYIASRSQHSTGAALDLTLVDLTADNSAKYDPSKSYADCTAPVEARAPEGSVDMGTGYDCTDTKGHTAAPSITPEQRAWRKRLVAAMAQARLCELFEGVVAFCLPGAGGAGL